MFYLLAFFVFALLVCDTAAGLACGLARSLALTAAALLCALAEVAGLYSFNMSHGFVLHSLYYVEISLPQKSPDVNISVILFHLKGLFLAAEHSTLALSRAKPHNFM